MSGVERLPNVPMSKGVRSVSPITSRIVAERRAQLLRDGLRERRADVLAELDLAGEDGDAAVLRDVEPGARSLVAFGASRPRPDSWLEPGGAATSTTTPAEQAEELAAADSKR